MSEVVLTVTATELEAEMVCGLLRTNEISCATRRTNMSAVLYAQALVNGGPTEVVVSDADLERARGILAQRA